MLRGNRHLYAKTLFALAALLLAACASSYKLNDAQLRYQKSLTKEEALGVFREAAMPTRSRGFCDTAVSVTPGKLDFQAAAEGYEFAAWSRGEEVSRTGNTIYYKKDYYVHRTKFSEISKIRIQPVNVPSCVAAQRPTSKQNYMIQMGKSLAFGSILIEIEPAKLDRFVAALAVLAPQASFIEGVGF